jgi:Protein of unknown function (DUF3710)
VALFGRRKRDLDDEAPEFDEDYADDEYDEDDDAVFEDGEVGGDLFDDAGPYDVDDAPEDGVPRLDLGALRVPVTPGSSELKVKMNPDGSLNEIYLIIPDLCVITVSVFAAPRSNALWREEWCGDLARDMREKGADVRSLAGAWGQELVVKFPGEVLRFLGVDGPRWMLRAVASSPAERMENAAAALYELVRGTVVVRGSIPMPVGMPLPLQLPAEVAAHIRGNQAGANRPNG